MCTNVDKSLFRPTVLKALKLCHFFFSHLLSQRTLIVILFVYVVCYTFLGPLVFSRSNYRLLQSSCHLSVSPSVSQSLFAMLYILALSIGVEDQKLSCTVMFLVGRFLLT